MFEETSTLLFITLEPDTSNQFELSFDICQFHEAEPTNTTGVIVYVLKAPNDCEAEETRLTYVPAVAFARVVASRMGFVVMGMALYE